MVNRRNPVRYQVPDEIFTHLSGRTGRIIRWLLTSLVQDAVGGGDGWEITIRGKGESLHTAIKVHRELK